MILCVDAVKPPGPVHVYVVIPAVALQVVVKPVQTALLPPVIAQIGSGFTTSVLAQVLWHLGEVLRLTPRLQQLCGVVLTLKLTEPRIASDVPAMLAALTNAGFEQVRAAQLPSHRRELVAVALTTRGRQRQPLA